ncbi:Homeodomain-interacting protein kinase 2 [Takifugu flavidus]|uniref:Homeodomain-interacting protein kinase 2 n=1 Tax=Takifugu flavidus TaxID=433684 RepID=A0A5C6NQX6_9TELE|nr:Homeodomain-interacting protein kinase 2 [Takifugu flavidus]
MSWKSLLPSPQLHSAVEADGDSPFLTYEVKGLLGKGTYGKVLKCTHMTTNVYMLRQLRRHGSSNHNIVNFYDSFSDSRHHFLVFEQLDKSLKDFLDERKWQRVPLRDIRPILLQMATALDFLKVRRFMHSDIKLENVMLVNHQKEPFRVKLIDFGLADKISRVEKGRTLQTLPYRAPEVFLILPLTEAADMWALGCLIAALLLGSLLYNGKSDYDIIVHNQNDTVVLILPRENRDLSPGSLDPEQPPPPSLSADGPAEEKDLLVFVDLLEQMLEFDATERITRFSIGSYPQSCVEKMEAFQRVPVGAAGHSLQHLSSRGPGSCKEGPEAAASPERQSVRITPGNTLRTSQTGGAKEGSVVMVEGGPAAQTSSGRTRERRSRGQGACLPNLLLGSDVFKRDLKRIAPALPDGSPPPSQHSSRSSPPPSQTDRSPSPHVSSFFRGAQLVPGIRSHRLLSIGPFWLFIAATLQSLREDFKKEDEGKIET